MEWNSDGCPNDCGYCRDLGQECVYTAKNWECPICHQRINKGDIYDYRGFESCGGCLDKLRIMVNEKRQKVIKANNDINYFGVETPIEKEYREGIL